MAAGLLLAVSCGSTDDGSTDDGPPAVTSTSVPPGFVAYEPPPERVPQLVIGSHPDEAAEAVGALVHSNWADATGAVVEWEPAAGDVQPPEIIVQDTGGVWVGLGTTVRPDDLEITQTRTDPRTRDGQAAPDPDVGTTTLACTPAMATPGPEACDGLTEPVAVPRIGDSIGVQVRHDPEATWMVVAARWVVRPASIHNRGEQQASPPSQGYAAAWLVRLKGTAGN